MASSTFRDGEQLLEELRAGFVRLKGTPGPIRDGQPHMVPFCETLENILRVGLKQPGSFLRVTYRDYWDWIEVLPTAKLGTARKNPLLTEAVNTVKKTGALKTPQGRGRCFLRLALVQKLIPIPVEYLLRNAKLLSYWYHKESIIREDGLAGQLINILFEVTELDFELTDRSSFLDETWISPEYVTVQLEPCHRLGLKLVHMRDRVLVDGVVKGSVVDRSQIETGDIVDEINGVRLFGMKVGQSQQLVTKHTGMINIIVAKSVMKDGTPFAPCQLRQVQVEAHRMPKTNHMRRTSSSGGFSEVDSPADRSPAPMPEELLQFDIVLLGVAKVKNPIDDGAIDAAIHRVLEGTDKPQAVNMILERTNLILCTNDAQQKPLHSFYLSDVAACARGVIHRTCFGFAAGDSRLPELDCFIFETPSDTKAKLVVSAMVSSFKRTTWFVPPPPSSSSAGVGADTADSALLASGRSTWRSSSASPKSNRSTSSRDNGSDDASCTFSRSISASVMSSDSASMSVKSRSISRSSEQLCDPVLRRSWRKSFFGGSPGTDGALDTDELNGGNEDTDVFAPSQDLAGPSPETKVTGATTETSYSDFEVITDDESAGNMAKQTQSSPVSMAELSQPSYIIEEESQLSHASMTEQSQPSPASMTEQSQPSPASMTEQSQPSPARMTEQSQPSPASMAEQTRMLLVPSPRTEEGSEAEQILTPTNATEAEGFHNSTGNSGDEVAPTVNANIDNAS